MTPQLPDKRTEDLRIPGYDLVRGLAVILMLFINFSDVFYTKTPGLLDRRAAVILVMVSGAGLSLMARQFKQDLDGCKRLLRNRALFLLALGYLLSPVWSGDILHFYGIFILAGIWFLDKPARVLLWTGVLICFSTLVQHLDGVGFFLEESNSLFGDLGKDILFTGYFPVFPWMSFFILGLGLGRLPLNTKSWVGMLILGLVLAASQELDLPGIPQILPALSGSLPFTLISGMGTGIAAIAGGHCLSGVGVLKKDNLIALLGRTSLTLYLAHIAFIWALDPVGVKISDKNTVLMLVALFLFFYIVFIRRWLKVSPKGPMETLMRRFDNESVPPAGIHLDAVKGLSQ